jgi:hypothetical protein
MTGKYAITIERNAVTKQRTHGGLSRYKKIYAKSLSPFST